MTKNELMTLLAAGACMIYFITHMLWVVNKPVVKPIPKNIELDTIQITPTTPVDHTVFVAS